MCGIAGIIYRDGGGERHVGRDMTAMLQAMKHRGPDSTGYALYRPESEGYVMHVKLMESNNGHHEFDFEERLRRQPLAHVALEPGGRRGSHHGRSSRAPA